MDATAARRTHVGAPIVHGAHSTLRLLDCIAETTDFLSKVQSIRVQFSQPIYVGEVANLEFSPPSGDVLRARLTVGSEEVLTAALMLETRARASLPMREEHISCLRPPDSPRELDFEDVQGCAGCLSFGNSIDEIGAMFPNAAAALGLQRVETLAHCSCLVGMVVPGLHSIFSGLDLSLSKDRDEVADAIRYTVLSTTSRFRLVRIGISGPGLLGHLETVSRMPPTRQPCVADAVKVVGSGEFHNVDALVVGGSRGLGELTAKLIAAGGGHVVITYASGRLDAEKIRDEIRSAGLSCTMMVYDVRRPAGEQIASLTPAPTHIYYFATPAIFRRKDGLFDTRRFDEFNAFYVSGFFDLVQACHKLRPAGLRIFYPSSSAIDHRPKNMTEYTMSKAAAEVLCTDISKFFPGVQIVTRRLPRLATDQTNSTVQVETCNATSVMLEVVRTMHQK